MKGGNGERMEREGEYEDGGREDERGRRKRWERGENVEGEKGERGENGEENRRKTYPAAPLIQGLYFSIRYKKGPYVRLDPCLFRNLF